MARFRPVALESPRAVDRERRSGARVVVKDL
jgi:hypothetical protein